MALVVFGIRSFSQSKPHSDLLRFDFYQEQAITIDCDSTTGSNPEHAICLYKDLVAAEVEMQTLLDCLSNGISNADAKSQLTSYQEKWSERRRFESYLAANHASGYLRDILILDHRLIVTQFRIAELKNINLNR